MIDQPNKKKKLSSSPDSNDNDYNNNAIVEKYQNPTWTIDEVVKETAEANESSKQSNNGIEEELQVSSSPKSQQSPMKKSSQQPPPPNPYTNIRRCIVTNDGTTKNLIRLIGLKSLFAKQLPKMPKVSYFFYYIVDCCFIGRSSIMCAFARCSFLFVNLLCLTICLSPKNIF